MTGGARSARFMVALLGVAIHAERPRQRWGRGPLWRVARAGRTAQVYRRVVRPVAGRRVAGRAFGARGVMLGVAGAALTIPGKGHIRGVAVATRHAGVHGDMRVVLEDHVARSWCAIDREMD